MYKNVCVHVSLHIGRVTYECTDLTSISSPNKSNETTNKEKQLDSDIKV